MNILFVAPSEVSSGEAITALRMAEDVLTHDDRVFFLASKFAAGFIAPSLPTRFTQLTDDRMQNQVIWAETIESFEPNLVVFADYPLLFFGSGVAPLVDDRWVAQLDTVDAAMATLDHLGYAQRRLSVFFGPAHRSIHAETTPPPSPRMQVLLPCPVHEPTTVDGRRGIPFRSVNLPLELPASRRASIRRKFLERAPGLLILHVAPRWGWLIAEQLKLPYYSFLPRLLSGYLRGLTVPVTVVSVNRRHLLGANHDRQLRFVDLPTLKRGDFEALLLSADLVLTENAVSVSLGTAACGLRPVAVLRNSYRLGEALARADATMAALIQDMERQSPGAVFPWEVFPIWDRNDIEELGLFRDSSYPATLCWLEAFGGAETAERLHQLLLDDAEQAALRDAQARYVEQLEWLPTPREVLLTAGERDSPLRRACHQPSRRLTGD
jgi:hypothetical protein